MGYIRKIKLKNFKRFESFEMDCDEYLNVLVGDNESGKSTILEAINLTLSGKRKRVDTLNLESLFNFDCIHNFLASERKFEDLPELFIELYFNEQNNEELWGRNNSEKIDSDGILFLCKPNIELSNTIKEILEQVDRVFPFEYYEIDHITFKGESYSGYKKYLKHILIDNSQIGNEYALKEYIRGMYYNNVEENEKLKHFSEYRKYKNNFTNDILISINSKMPDYNFAVKNNTKYNLETDLTIFDNGIDIENKGKGRQSIIKTEFALSKGGDNIDIVLIEEPENHLSHTNVKKIIANITNSVSTQLFISTHSNTITARLDLRKAILLNSHSKLPILLKSLNESTAKFFIKAPDNNILDYILSEKVILVEGDAEYILFEQFFKNITNSEIKSFGIHVISVGGLKFKRYLELGKLLKIKTAVVRDNDANYEKNIIENYEPYISDNVKIFSDQNNENKTFEFCLYNCNVNICEELIGTHRRTLSTIDYMLGNKTESALELLEKQGSNLNVPDYIKESILWIKA
ncbi:MAG: AAA family ATPase [Ignavibacteriales bacterium]|nr:AAA family ATPase [Ignavibacteriales bacterium]